MSLVVTGGCGFIGTNFVQHWLRTEAEPIINIDCLSYASNPTNVLINSDKYEFYQVDLNSTNDISDILSKSNPRAVIHFAAETHVDNSIHNPSRFIQSNVCGTASLLSACNTYWNSLNKTKKSKFVFVNVSTDEVYGSLPKTASPFTESDLLKPSNPYSASKAAAEHIARSYWKTYGFPVVSTRCSNNFGPHQHDEKLIPSAVSALVNSKKIGIYGDGTQIREWIYVNDHVSAINCVLSRGAIGEVYNVGSGCELQNIQLAREICLYFDAIRCTQPGWHFKHHIDFIPDRLGHDFRYAMDSSHISRTLGWVAQNSFNESIRSTIDWHIQRNTFRQNDNCVHIQSDQWSRSQSTPRHLMQRRLESETSAR